MSRIGGKKVRGNSPGGGSSARSGCAELGAVTVEAALGICSVVAVLVLALVALGAVIGQLRCTDAATEAARLVARGEPGRAPEAVALLAPRGATLDVTVRGDRITTEVRAPPTGRFPPGQWLNGEAFAVAEPGTVPLPSGSGHPR